MSLHRFNILDLGARKKLDANLIVPFNLKKGDIAYIYINESVLSTTNLGATEEFC